MVVLNCAKTEREEERQEEDEVVRALPGQAKPSQLHHSVSQQLAAETAREINPIR